VHTSNIAPDYAILDLSLLKHAVAKLSCAICSGGLQMQVTRTKNKNLAFKYNFVCTSCLFNVEELSTPLVKSTYRKRQQSDLQIRLPVVAQTVGIKYKQMRQFLDLLGIHSPISDTWHTSSDDTFDAIEQVTLRSTKKAVEEAMKAL